MHRREVSFSILLITLVLLCLPVEKVQASAYQNWSGIWLTNHGEMKLEQDGRSVSGTYSIDNEVKGFIEGEIKDEWGFILQGKYFEAADSGMFEFRIVESNESFQGWLNSWDNTWNGRRISGVCGETYEQQMTILNNSPYYITAIFVCPANSEEWQEVLGGIELRSGKQRNAVFNLDNGICRWDIKIVDSSGSFTVFPNLQIKRDFTSINYYYKDGIGRISFAVG
jgi:hypothetical protein